jgi:hypothetical protein
LLGREFGSGRLAGLFLGRRLDELLSFAGLDADDPFAFEFGKVGPDELVDSLVREDDLNGFPVSKLAKPISSSQPTS